MTNCWIFDDIYWKDIYHELKHFLPNFKYPVKSNVDNPIPFLPEIKNWDFIILDNFFFWDWKEQPLWDDFLWQYLKLKYKCKIICISNYGEKNRKYRERYQNNTNLDCFPEDEKEVEFVEE